MHQPGAAIGARLHPTHRSAASTAGGRTGGLVGRDVRVGHWTLIRVDAPVIGMPDADWSTRSPELKLAERCAESVEQGACRDGRDCLVALGSSELFADVTD